MLIYKNPQVALRFNGYSNAKEHLSVSNQEKREPLLGLNFIPPYISFKAKPQVEDLTQSIKDLKLLFNKAIEEFGDNEINQATNAEIFKSIENKPKIISNAVDILLESEDYLMHEDLLRREATTQILFEIMSEFPSQAKLVNDKLNRPTKGLNHSDPSIKSSAINLLAKMATIDKSLVNALFDKIAPELSNDNDEVKFASILAMEDLALTTPEVAGKIYNYIKETGCGINDQDDCIKSHVYNVLGLVAVKNSELARDVFDFMIENKSIKNESDGVRFYTIVAFKNILGANSGLAGIIRDQIIKPDQGINDSNEFVQEEIESLLTQIDFLQ